MDNGARLISVTDDEEIRRLRVILLLGLARELGLHVRGTRVRIPDVAVRAICLNHHAFDGDLSHDLAVLLRLHRAAIDAQEEVKLADGLHFGQVSREAVHHAGWESVAILAKNVNEVRACSARVQVHGQVVLLSQLEMRFKGLELAHFVSVFEPVVVQTTLSNGHDFAGGGLGDEVVDFGEILFKETLALFLINDGAIRSLLWQSSLVRLESAARVDSDRRVEVLISHAQLETRGCIFQVARSKQEFSDAELIGAFDALIEVWRVALLAVVPALVSVVRHVGCDVKNVVRLPVR